MEWCFMCLECCTLLIYAPVYGVCIRKDCKMRNKRNNVCIYVQKNLGRKVKKWFLVSCWLCCSNVASLLALLLGRTYHMTGPTLVAKSGTSNVQEKNAAWRKHAGFNCFSLISFCILSEKQTIKRTPTNTPQNPSQPTPKPKKHQLKQPVLKHQQFLITWRQNSFSSFRKFSCFIDLFPKLLLKVESLLVNY